MSEKDKNKIGKTKEDSDILRMMLFLNFLLLLFCMGILGVCE